MVGASGAVNSRGCCALPAYCLMQQGFLGRAFLFNIEVLKCVNEEDEEVQKLLLHLEGEIAPELVLLPGLVLVLRPPLSKLLAFV